jgi:(1->4)-alpha-D-glucan 1-alpha-D-glucosylmutase
MTPNEGASQDPQAAPAQREADHSELLRLCQRHGIGAEYHDIWGRHRVVPEHGLRALLRAMGIEAGDAAQVQASLRAAQRDDANPGARSALPPVLLFWEDAGERRVEIAPAARGPTLLWRLAEEGGALHEGPVGDGNIALPERLPLGYHRLELTAAAAAPAAEGGRRLVAAALVVVAPRRSYLPPLLEEGRRVWGPSVQLYTLRSARNWGIGDFTDLAAVVRLCGAHGAALVGLNPLHALYPGNPEHASPYAPSSRRFLDVLYLDVEAILDFADCVPARAQVLSAHFQDRLQELRQRELVDYAGVAAAKMPVLELLYAWFRRQHLARPEAPRSAAFRAFQSAGGAPLRLHATFEALQEHFQRADPAVWGWPAWPFEFRDPAAPAVAQFALEQLERIEFYEYLQWQAEEQLAAAGAAALEARLGVGLYQDLAVSIDRGGAESWSAQDLYAQGASAGCPPDDFNLRGQDWGLLPLLPERLRARAYAPFIATLRASMRHAGALRIDHVMGLARLFWVPRGDQPDAGAYVSYPFEHLLGILNLESRRNLCMVIGEDLGTVPDEVRHAMDRSGMLSYRVLYFSHRHDGEFLAPQDFPRDALVTATTHDLATLAGFWEGRDLEVRRSLQLFPSDAVQVQQFEERKRDAVRLLAALRREGLLPDDIEAEPRWPVPMNARLAAAVQEYLGRTPCRVLCVQLEDIFGCRDQVNLPGTVDQYANWRRKLPVPLEQWEEDHRFAELARRLAPLRRN